MGCTADKVTELFRGEFSRIFELVSGAGVIAISGHTNPDGDALGSALGLGLSLRCAFPQKEVVFLLADDAPVPRILRFMAGVDDLIPARLYEGSPDLFIGVDAPTAERLADSAVVMKRSRHAVCFDHHPAREEFAEVIARHPDSAACAVLIERFLAACGLPLTPDIATCLLCGIVTDTGRFQYQNADAVAFHVASKLVASGADTVRIALEVYQSQRLEYLHLKSIVMGRIATVAHGRVAYSYAYASDLARFGVNPDECDGLVDSVRAVRGVEVCLFLKEVEGTGKVRGNLRSKGELDVSSIAARFDGGGHAAAAGFTFEGTVRDTLNAALPMLVELVGEDPTGVCCKIEGDARLVPYRASEKGCTPMLSAGNTGMFPGLRG